jgi:hypothetical protein
MRSSYILAREREAEELIRTGQEQQAAELCDVIAEYYSGEEANCDAAGESAEGMRASRAAEFWSARARELRGRGQAPL